MCGRFTTTVDLEEIARFFKIKSVEGNYSPLYNAAPSQNIPVIIGNEPRKLVFFRWGLIPSWAKDETIGNKLINARAETLAEKPGFRDSFRNRRCLIAADGFYEWKKEGREKIPYRFTLKNRSLFAMAGLWECWSPQGKTPLYTCTVITTPANALVSEFHDRMPAIVNPRYIERWLDSSVTGRSLLDPLLLPYPAGAMECRRVSQAVNSPANNSHEVIRPV